MAKDTSKKKKSTYGSSNRSWGSTSSSSSSSSKENEPETAPSRPKILSSPAKTVTPTPASKPRRIVEVRNTMNQAVVTYRFVDDASKPSGKRMKQFQLPGRGPERNLRMPEEDVTKHMKSLVERQLLRIKPVTV
jgi:hypothetical protein